MRTKKRFSPYIYIFSIIIFIKYIFKPYSRAQFSYHKGKACGSNSVIGNSKYTPCKTQWLEEAFYARKRDLT